jgi:hypothetical protein
MSGPTIDPSSLLETEERLRQERETFNQRKSHEERWFSLRLRMGYAAVVMLPSIAVFCGSVLWSHDGYPTGIVTAAGTTLFADVVGFMIAVWRVVLSPAAVTRLEPVTGRVLVGTLDAGGVGSASTGEAQAEGATRERQLTRR